MFTDVSANDWAYKSILKVAESGRMSGYPDGTFAPDAPITRREMASVLARQMAWDGSFKDILPAVMPAVMTLYFGGTLGSGVFVSGEGHIITNRHVAEVSTTGTMTVIKDGQDNVSAKIISVSALHDLALLKVDFAPPAYLKLAEADCERGDHVGVLGSPKGYSDSFTQGVVSHPLRVGSTYSSTPDCFQFDAPSSPGNSGGPVINEAGEMIGFACTKFIALDTEGLAWAVHARYARELLVGNGVIL